MLPVEFKPFNVVVQTSIRIDIFTFRALVDFPETRSCLVCGVPEEPDCIDVIKPILQIILLRALQLSR